MRKILSGNPGRLVNRLNQSELQPRFSGDAHARPGKHNAGERTGCGARSSADTCSGSTSRESTDHSPESSCAADGGSGAAALRSAGLSLESGSKIDGLIRDGHGLECHRQFRLSREMPGLPLFR